MAKIICAKEDITPSAPPTGYIKIFPQGSAIKYIDENSTIYTLATGISAEEVEDIVALLVKDSATVSWTYDDSLDGLYAAVIPSGIDHNALSNFVASRHIDHSEVSVLAGTGLTGGGDLTANRTLALGTVGTAGNYGTASSIPVITTDLYGRVTAVVGTPVAIPSTQITDFAESVDDRVASLLLPGTGISLTYNDAANALSISSLITQYTDEQAQDAVAALLQNGTGISWAYNDSLNTLTPTISLASFSTSNLAEGSNLYFTSGRAQASISVSDTSSLDLSYSSGAISGVVLPAGVDHNSLLNFSANRHIDHSAVSIAAGTGLTGGGDLTANRTLALAPSGVTASSYGTATQVASYSVDTYGRLTASANTLIAIPSTQITDFSTAVKAQISVADTSSVNLTYSAGVVSGVVLPAGVDHNSLLNFSANRHIDHSAVSIAAGTGLTGGGDLTANRTLSMPSIGTPGTYGDHTHFPVITTDVQGRVTSVTTQYIANVWEPVAGGLQWTDNAGLGLLLEQVGNTPGTSSFIQQRRSRGTVASKSSIITGDKIGSWSCIAWGGSAYNVSSGCEISSYAVENHSASAAGSELRVLTTPTGTTTRSLAMTVQGSGLVVLENALRVGDTSDTTAGNMRFNGTELLIRQGGAWVVVAPVPVSYNSTSAISTTSATFSTMSGMSVTPSAGTYLVSFSCDCGMTADSNGDVALFIGAAEVSLARRNFGANTSGTGVTVVTGVVCFNTIITVNGAQTVTVQYRENLSGTFSVNARELILTPISR